MTRLGVRNGAAFVEKIDPAPWTRWKKKSSLPGRAVRWIETFCIPSKGHHPGKNIKLGKWQTDWLEEVLQPAVQASVMTLPRGQGKSTFGGAVGTWALFDPVVAEAFGGKPDIPIIAPTLKQARKGVYGAAMDFRHNHPELSSRSILYTAWSQERITVPSTQGEIYPISADMETLQGLDPMVAFCDEVGFISVDCWDALLLSAGKRPRNLILGIGTRNPADEPNALDHLLSVLATEGSIPGFVLVDYSARPDTSIDDRDEWIRANPAIGDGYLRMDALEQARKLTPAPAFKTFRLNQKTGSQIGWLGVNGPTLWDESVGDVVFSKTEPMFLGVDKSAYSDMSAVVQLQKIGMQWYTRARIFVPNPVIDHAAVRQHIRDLHATYNIVCGFDDRYFVEGAEELEAEGIAMVKVPQTPQRMVPAYSYLYSDLMSGLITHEEDLMFRAHILGAVPMLDRSGGFMLAKGRSKTHIDAAVALGIARAVSGIGVETPLDDDSFVIY